MDKVTTHDAGFVRWLKRRNNPMLSHSTCCEMERAYIAGRRAGQRRTKRKETTDGKR